MRLKITETDKEKIYSFVKGFPLSVICSIGESSLPLRVKGAYLLFPPHFAEGGVLVSDEFIVKIAEAIEKEDYKELVSLLNKVNRLLEKEEKGTLRAQNLLRPFLPQDRTVEKETLSGSFKLNKLREKGESTFAFFLSVPNGEKTLRERLYSLLMPYLPEEVKIPLKELLRSITDAPEGNFKRFFNYLLLHSEPFEVVYFGTTDDGLYNLYGIYPKNFKKRYSPEEVIKEAREKLSEFHLERYSAIVKKAEENFLKLLSATGKFLKENYKDFLKRLEKESPEEITSISFAVSSSERISVSVEAELNYSKKAVMVIRGREGWTEKYLKKRLEERGIETRTYQVWFSWLFKKEGVLFSKEGEKRPAFFYLALGFALFLAKRTLQAGAPLLLFRFYSEREKWDKKKEKLSAEEKKRKRFNEAYDEFISFARLIYGFSTLLPFQGYTGELYRHLKANYWKTTVNYLIRSSTKKGKRISLRAPLKTYFSRKGHLVREIAGGLIIPTCPGRAPESPLSRRHRLFEVYSYKVEGKGEETQVSLSLEGVLIRLAGGEEVKLGTPPKKLKNPIYIISDLSLPLDTVKELILPIDPKENDSIVVITMDDFPITHFTKNHKEITRKSFILFKEDSGRYASLMERFWGERGKGRHFYTVFPPLPPTVKDNIEKVGFTTSHGDTYLLFPESSGWLEGAKSLELLFLALGIFRNDLSNFYSKEKSYLKDYDGITLYRLGHKFVFPKNSLLIEAVARLGGMVWRG